jgi:hypothetical protein
MRRRDATTCESRREGGSGGGYDVDAQEAGACSAGGETGQRRADREEKKKRKRTKGTGNRSLTRVSSVVDVMEIQNLAIHHLHSTKKKGKAPKGCQ